MKISRRSFCGGIAAFGGMAGCTAFTAGAETPRLRFGVVSDVHIGGRREAPERLEFALRWLKGRGVDAVLCPGDIAHSGSISQMERFAGIWHKVFPAGESHVELMIATGNHDIDAYSGRWKGYDEKRMLEERFNYRDNPQKVWRRLFGRDWSTVWRRDVKGYTFIGAQWESLKPPVEEFVKANAATMDPSRPFFYCQHRHPAETCFTAGAGDMADGSVRALAPFPNAVAISGHSHFTLADERAVWQGSFTSIGAGCLHEGGMKLTAGYANASAFWHPTFKKNFMKPLGNADAWGGDELGGCFEMIDVYGDRLVVHRRSSLADVAIGPSWTVPLPAAKGGGYDPAKRAALFPAPEFAADARAVAAMRWQGHEMEGVSFKGVPCAEIAFPRALPSGRSRVYDYTVAAHGADGREIFRTSVVAAGFSRPAGADDAPETCLVPFGKIAGAGGVSFTVTPRNCFGKEGRPLRCSIAADDLASPRAS